MTLPNNQQTNASTPDSPDTHIIPAETAARKDREGSSYKQLPDNPESADSIDTSSGFTVDSEGLANNYAVEPEMYFETPGDVHFDSDSAALTDTYTIVDIFPVSLQAEGAVAEMKKAGLAPHQISIIGKNYPNTEPVHGALNWQDIAQTGGLAVVLNELGISRSEAAQYEAEIAAGKFVVLVTGSDEDIAQANQILHNIGHRTRTEEMAN